jgi:uncharacterized protein involved in cysteine biosynthesis
MKEFVSQLNYVLGFILTLMLIVLIGSFIPVVNFIVWIGAPIVLLAYPFLHSTLYKQRKLFLQQEEEKKLIAQYNHQKSLAEAKSYFG